MICFGTVFNLVLLGSGADFAFVFGRPILSQKCCLAVAGGSEVEEGFNFGFEADAGSRNAPLLRLGWLDPGVNALAHGFCWLVPNLDTCTLGLGDTAGDLEGDLDDLNALLVKVVNRVLNCTKSGQK